MRIQDRGYVYVYKNDKFVLLRGGLMALEPGDSFKLRESTGEWVEGTFLASSFPYTNKNYSPTIEILIVG